MRSIVRRRYGDSGVIELADVPVPSIHADEVLVRVVAAGVNMADWHLMTGTPSLVRLAIGVRTPRRPGCGIDLAGTVEAVGAKVTRFSPGDEVFGCGVGTFADYAVTAEKRLALKPASVTFSQASAAPTAGLTAIEAMRAGAVASGERVLVIGAGGGVGSCVVQLAVAVGARVTGVCSTAKVEFVRSLGAESVIDYTRDDVARAAHRFDVIVDIAGLRPLPELRRVLAPRGTLVLVGGEGGGPIAGGTVNRQLGATIRSLFTRQHLKGLVSLENPQNLESLRAALEDGSLVPRVERPYPIELTAAAMDHVSEGRALGKIVIELSPAESR